MVGQIYHEGMDAMTVGHCFEQQGSGGAVSPKRVQGRALVGVQEAKSPEAPGILQNKV